MEVIIKASRQRCPDSRDLLEVGDTGPHHPLQATEMLQQLAALRRPESGDHLEHRFIVAAGALAPVTRDGKAMRLVADALNET